MFTIIVVSICTVIIPYLVRFADCWEVTGILYSCTCVANVIVEKELCDHTLLSVKLHAELPKAPKACLVLLLVALAIYLD